MNDPPRIDEVVAAYENLSIAYRRDLGELRAELEATKLDAARWLFLVDDMGSIRWQPNVHGVHHDKQWLYVGRDYQEHRGTTAAEAIDEAIAAQTK